jgi:hypothetical protein
MTAPSKPFQDQVPHVSGDSGASDIFHGGDDVGEPLTRVSALVSVLLVTNTVCAYT